VIVGVDRAQSRLRIPDSPILDESGVVALKYRQIAFSFLKANSTIRISSHPSRNREICVSP
jgi:hypothetical protein